jgi:hypothetical protein
MIVILFFKNRLKMFVSERKGQFVSAFERIHATLQTAVIFSLSVNPRACMGGSSASRMTNMSTIKLTSMVKALRY